MVKLYHNYHLSAINDHIQRIYIFVNAIISVKNSHFIISFDNSQADEIHQLHLQYQHGYQTQPHNPSVAQLLHDNLCLLNRKRC